MSAAFPVPDYSGVGREQFQDLIRFKMSPDDFKYVMQAYRFAKTGHYGQERDNGGRYFEHPKRVALILMLEFGVYDPEVSEAALQHDIKEDVPRLFGVEDARENIEMVFKSRRVAEYIDILSKRPCRPEEKPTRDREYFDSIANADVRVRIIKMADRLDNLRDIHDCDAGKQVRYRKETEEEVLPIVRELLAAREIPEDIRNRLCYAYHEMVYICDSLPTK